MVVLSATESSTLPVALVVKIGSGVVLNRRYTLSWVSKDKLVSCPQDVRNAPKAIKTDNLRYFLMRLIMLYFYDI